KLLWFLIFVVLKLSLFILKIGCRYLLVHVANSEISFSASFPLYCLPCWFCFYLPPVGATAYTTSLMQVSVSTSPPSTLEATTAATFSPSPSNEVHLFPDPPPRIVTPR
ncbi:hypothetical protein V8G54_030895, partial [Vigna mungo]